MTFPVLFPGKSLMLQQIETKDFPRAGPSDSRGWPLRAGDYIGLTAFFLGESEGMYWTSLWRAWSVGCSRAWMKPRPWFQ